MTLAAAQAAAQEWKVALLDHGVRTVSIELQPGVGPKGDPWGPAPFVRGLGHHIASRPSQGRTPGLATVKTGRKGENPLQGPLANAYGGFDLVARIITLGWANHPGEGGPWSVPGWGTVPRDNGRPYAAGWEFEGGYEPWSDEMHDFMARCGAGTLDWLGWLNRREPAPLECWGEHADPWAPRRKIDRLGYTAASGRSRIAAVRGNPAPPLNLGDSTVRLVKVVNTGGPFYLVTDTDVTATHDIALVEAEARANGIQSVDMHWEQIVKLIDSRKRRAAALGLDDDDRVATLDEASVTAIVSGLGPRLAEDLASRTGATRGEVEAVFRDVLGSVNDPA